MYVHLPVGIHRPPMKPMQIPPDAVISSSGVTWLDPSGILIAVGRDHAIHTIAHALENHRVCAELAQGVRRPFLVDMTEVKSMSHEARAFYAGPEPAKVLTAVAIVTHSAMGKIVANLFMSLTKPILPTKMFTDWDTAKEWLNQFKESAGAAQGAHMVNSDLLQIPNE